VYFIDKKAVPLLADELGVFPEDIDWHPRNNDVGWMFLDHLLATNDVRIAIEVATECKGFEIANWVNERSLKSREMRDSVEIVGPRGARHRVTIVPDGYFCLNDGQYEYHNFLEVDMGTETGRSSKFGRRDFSRKIRGYLGYYNSGKYQQKYDPDQEYDDLPMRVLTVTTGRKRMANLKQVTENVLKEAKSASAGSLFWFTTFEMVTPETVLSEPIWEVAGQDGRAQLVW
jgi:hypothetical protein